MQMCLMGFKLLILLPSDFASDQYLPKIDMINL